MIHTCRKTPPHYYNFVDFSLVFDLSLYTIHKLVSLRINSPAVFYPCPWVSPSHSPETPLSLSLIPSSQGRSPPPEIFIFAIHSQNLILIITKTMASDIRSLLILILFSALQVNIHNVINLPVLCLCLSIVSLILFCNLLKIYSAF